MLNGLDLFSGIGGIALALKPWVKPVAYCEIDRYCQGVLLSRFASGDLPAAPIWDDVCTLRSEMLPPIDLISGGFPCQDISVAGRRAGLEGERSGLVFEIFRLVSETRPSFVFLENVADIRTSGAERVGKELASLGYDCRWGLLSAEEMGAPHERQRWWCLAADVDGLGLRYGRQRDSQGETKASDQSEHHGCEKPLAYPDRERQLQSGRRLIALGGRARDGSQQMADADKIRMESERLLRERDADLGGGHWWSIEPDLGRVAYGVPAHMERISALGNSVVPQCARAAFAKLMGLF